MSKETLDDINRKLNINRETVKYLREKIKELQNIERELLDHKELIRYSETNAKITYDELIGRFRYDPLDGFFYNLLDNSISNYHTVVGGYRHMSIGGANFPVHRLAWLYMTSKFPIYQIDHIDNIPSNNKWENLREATSSQNGFNKPKYKCNTSGRKGVTWHKTNKKWLAQTTYKGKTYNLGYYVNLDDASDAYQNFVKEHHGEFKKI